MDSPVFTAALVYQDPKAALGWLAQAFGFDVLMAIDSPDGDPARGHYEMSSAGHGRIMIGGEWADFTRSPGKVGGSSTAHVHVALTTDVDAHCEHARAAGAVILAEPEDQFWGGRTYRAQDPEGHVWTFAQQVREVSRAQAEAAIGIAIQAPGWD